MPARPSRRALGTAAAATAVATPLAAAYRFALEYRRRAGFPARRPPLATPADDGLAFEPLEIPSPPGPLPAWFVPARDGAVGPGGRPGPRLGVEPRPHAAERPVPARRGLPHADVRRPGARREPARDAPDQRRRVRRRHAGRRRRRCERGRRSRAVGILGPLDGRGRRGARGRGRAAASARWSRRRSRRTRAC